MWRTGLVAPRRVGSSQTRARTRVPCFGKRILNHCTTREVPQVIFVKDVRPVSKFTVFGTWVSSYSNTIWKCWKDCLYSTVLPLLFCQRSVDYVYVGLYLGFLFCVSLIYFSVLWTVSHCHDYCSFVVSCEIGWCQSSDFVLLIQY